MARGWKRIAELVVARSGMAHAAERRTRPSTVILAYHNIVPRGETAVGDLSLHIDQDTFSNQLDFLLERRVVIGLGDALSLEQREDTGTQIVVTFDDAYAGAMSAGLAEMAKRGLPTTVFVPPGLLGSPGFWWDRIAPRDHRPLDMRLREVALRTHQGRTEPILAWAAREGVEVQDMPDHARPVDAGALRQSCLSTGTTLGAHTWSHPNLAALTRTEMDEEMRKSREWLVSASDRYVDWLAYPYGLHDDVVQAAARRHFQGALLVSGGFAVTQGQRTGTRHSVPRLNVPRGLSLEGLALRVGGLLA